MSIAKDNTLLDQLFKTLAITAENSYVYVCDLENDYFRWSNNAVEYFGLPGSFIEDGTDIWEEHVHPDDRERYHKNYSDIILEKSPTHDIQYRARNCDGEYVICSGRGAIIKDANGEPAYFVATIRKNNLQGNIDPLTGLKNLYSFFADIQSTMQKTDKCWTLLLGVHGFDEVNDVYGYSFGNRVIIEIAKIIKECFSSYGEVYRMEGIKFACISKNLNLYELQDAYDEARQRIRHDIKVDGKRIPLLLSGGCMLVDNEGVVPQTIYTCLKFAYYSSRDQKQGELTPFNDQVGDSNRRLTSQLNAIRESVIYGCEGFFLLYQPIIDSATEKLVGTEALIRWENDVHGYVAPDQFVPYLEKDAVFYDLGKWILHRAIDDTLPFVRENPEFVVNVNLSYSQMERSEFLSDVMDILMETGFPPQNLCLEITERCRLLDLDILLNTVVFLKSQGVQFALDDFGTGYSSLNLLKNVPVDVIKIDKEYVLDAETNIIDRSIVEGISRIVDKAGLYVCAEGVETVAIRDYLRQYPIRHFQGFLYDEPIPIDTLVNKYGKALSTR